MNLKKENNKKKNSKKKERRFEKRKRRQEELNRKLEVEIKRYFSGGFSFLT